MRLEGESPGLWRPHGHGTVLFKKSRSDGLHAPKGPSSSDPATAQTRPEVRSVTRCVHHPGTSRPPVAREPVRLPRSSFLSLLWRRPLSEAARAFGGFQGCLRAFSPTPPAPRSNLITLCVPKDPLRSRPSQEAGVTLSHGDLSETLLFNPEGGP